MRRFRVYATTYEKFIEMPDNVLEESVEEILLEEASILRDSTDYEFEEVFPTMKEHDDAKRRK